jgi:hypothetical protein
MRCVWCGSKGGFVNRLWIHLVDDLEPVCECEWCSLKIEIELMKEAN